MKTKGDIVQDWLPRYTGLPLAKFGKFILLVNFQKYVQCFADWFKVPVYGMDKPMPNATAEGITIINFGMGSANADLGCERNYCRRRRKYFEAN